MINSSAAYETGLSVPSSCVVQTPELLAAAMARALGSDATDKWLEPCVGQGALLKALAEVGVGRSKIVGLDIDASSQPNDRFGRVLRGREFLRWSKSTRLRFDKIIANPPYLAIERLDPELRSAALGASLSRDITITGNANAWYAFLCAAIRLLKKNGSLCFLLPAAWDFADYASALRFSISKYFEFIEIFRTTVPIFRANKVQEGAIVLLAKRRCALRHRVPCPGVGVVSRRELSSIEELINVLSRDNKKCAPNEVLYSEVRAPSIRKSYKQGVLKNFVTIRLGIVTGDTSYFLLTEQRRRELRLPLGSVQPVLSRARHLVATRLTAAKWQKLKELDERVWLFNPPPHTIDNQSVQSYLQYGLNGGCKVENHKVAIRNPWFRIPVVGKFDGFISGMSASLPWLSFCEMPSLMATNTLYVVSFIDDTFSASQKLGFAMSLLTSEVRGQMRERGRTYAAGLLKFEPSDLLGLRVPEIGRVVANRQDYALAVRALNIGDEKTCIEIADRCLKFSN